jgi:AhpC/TSA family
MNSGKRGITSRMAKLGDKPMRSEPLSSPVPRAAKDEGRIFPPDVVALMHKSTAELAASGQAERALQAGDLAPSFVLPDANDARASSKDLLAKGPLVLTFYRGVWCPYCNLDLQAIEEVALRIRGLGATLAAAGRCPCRPAT